MGRYCYALTFTTDLRRAVFVDANTVDLVLTQILRAASEKRFALIAYCFMTDHLHAVIKGEAEDSDCRTFVKAAKQYSGYCYAQAFGQRLWQRYGYDRVIRDERELTMTVRYIVPNPVRAGLVASPIDYPFLGSTIYSVPQLLEWCEYSEAVL